MAPAEHRVERVIAWSSSALVAFLSSFRWVYEADWHWHLAQGRLVAEGTLPRTNTFSAAFADFPQPYVPWLFDLGAYVLQQLGDGAVQFVLAAAVTLALGLTWETSRLRGGAATSRLAVLLLGAMVVAPRVLPRPYIASWLGLALIAWCIERARSRRSARPLWWTVGVIALWANLHVEAVFGAAIVCFFVVTELLKRDSAFTGAARQQALLAGALSVVATFCSPYGSGLHRYLYENSLVPGVIRIAELQPPYFPNYLAFFALAVLSAFALARNPRASWFELCVTAGATLMALKYLRFTPMPVFIASAFIAEGLGAPGVWGRRAVMTLCAALLPFIQELTGALLHAPRVGLTPKEIMSERGIAFIQSHGLEGPLFNSMNLGGFLAWRLWPHAQIFQDSRLQSYPSAHFRRVMDASRAQPAWDQLMTGIDWAVLSLPRENELSGAGRFPRAQWTTVFWDDAFEILVRRDGHFAELARTRGYEVLLPGASPPAAPPEREVQWRREDSQ